MVLMDWSKRGLGKIVACTCKDCLEKQEKLQKQLDHKFYKDAEAFREEIKMETMAKATEKYNEPFNPENWTIEQLAKHAMAENYDQQNYIYGMYERLQQLEKKNAILSKELLDRNQTITQMDIAVKYWRDKANEKK